ncbi:MAG: zinc-dependent alcohol dehydrogenase family protein [Thermoanaerobaculia bacterium]
MRAAVLRAPHAALSLEERDPRECGAGEVRIRVAACGVCRTDLHLVDGELPGARYPIVPGHQIVGTVESIGRVVSDLAPGDRVGIPWLGWSCGVCEYCERGEENLCDRAEFTGCHRDGGFADYAVADRRFAFRIPDGFSDLEAAPLLCAGLIGYRALRMTGGARRIGFYGFGSAAHVIIQLARWEGREIFGFTRAGDTAAQAFAQSLGAVWAGDSMTLPPAPLDAAIIFAPAGELVPAALRAVRKGGTVICAGIHMSDIPSFPYSILWGERVVRSVANLTRRDGEEFLALAPRVPIRTEITTYPLDAVNEALADLREGRLKGSAVVMVGA